MDNTELETALEELANKHGYTFMAVLHPETDELLYSIVPLTK